MAGDAAYMEHRVTQKMIRRPHSSRETLCYVEQLTVLGGAIEGGLPISNCYKLDISIIARQHFQFYYCLDIDNNFHHNMAETDPKSVQDLTNVVQTLLQQMQDKFQTITRIDDLEKNISDLMTQAGVEEIEAAPEKPKDGS
ncbi:hypothetical protein F7725_022560 [Dissostichus mawsoni]|uniref:Heat shock factor binding protein 1 n=1 Tax=Dissostichus mawsoni TaxID=36200 RepID=A0A7J5YYA4_DISMA|nr:hypothetical protein F7725_022560 [Dissostichus mawsoni]